MAIATPKLLGGQQIQQSHESYPLSGGRHDIQYAFKKEKIKAPCYRKLYISWNIRYISTFPSVWVYSPVSAASHFFKQKKYPATTVRQRFIILVPAYKEDAVIHACVTSVLRQTYPAELYDLIVISDHMRPETNASLRKERIGLIELHEKESSKAKALRIAAETITDQPYDYVLILDADNLISPCYLQELNKAVSQV